METSAVKPDPETVRSEVPPPPPLSGGGFVGLDVVLRVLLFAVTLAAIILMVTAKQTEQVAVAGYPILVPVKAKFNYSPANIYFVAALSVACLHSITSTLGHLATISKPAKAAKALLYLAIWDVLVLGLVAAATGTAGGVAYVGLKGNKHAGWTKICSVYDTYCRHLGASIALSLAASVILVLLVFLSVVSLFHRIPRPSC